MLISSSYSDHQLQKWGGNQSETARRCLSQELALSAATSVLATLTIIWYFSHNWLVFDLALTSYFLLNSCSFNCLRTSDVNTDSRVASSFSTAVYIISPACSIYSATPWLAFITSDTTISLRHLSTRRWPRKALCADFLVIIWMQKFWFFSRNNFLIDHARITKYIKDTQIFVQTMFLCFQMIPQMV